MIEKIQLRYPLRYVAVKLLEEDETISKEVQRIQPLFVSAARKLATEIVMLHGHTCSPVITSELYEIAGGAL
ncbi:MAG: hypothetical protein QXX95_05940 [Nitrososphaerales archaeon]